MKKKHLVDINLSGNELNNAIIPGYGYSDQSINTSDGLNLVKGKLVLRLDPEVITNIHCVFYPAIPYEEVGLFDTTKYRIILEMYDQGRWRICNLAPLDLGINSNVVCSNTTWQLPIASLITQYLNVEGTWNPEKHKYSLSYTTDSVIINRMLKCIHPTNDDTHILFTKYFRFSLVVFLQNINRNSKFHRSVSSPEFRYIYTADVDPTTYHVNNSKSFLAKRKGFTKGIY